MTGLSLGTASRPGAVGDLRAAGTETVRHIASTPEAAGEARGGPGVPIRNLLSSLDSSGIRYCHWKSNIRLEESFSGKGDLDLLVHREDLSGFQAALFQNGFKFAVSGNGMAHPGVLHAFALDPERLGLLHVHAYLQIATGDSLVKSYRLPFEATLLERTRRLNGVPVPMAAVELVLFAIRIALKHTSLVELLLLHRHYGSTARELQWLRSNADPDEADRVWREWLPQIPVELFHGLLDAIPDHRGGWRRIRLGHRLARHLRGWRRLGPVAAAGSRWWRVLMLVLGRIRRRRGLVPQSSGIIIGFVGPKATGKSTLTREAARRLGQHFDVRCVHVGKPPPTPCRSFPSSFCPSRGGSTPASAPASTRARAVAAGRTIRFFICCGRC